MKMASLGHFFGLGVEEHRALADARMTLEVVRNAGCVCFLERGCAAAMDGEDTAEAGAGGAGGAGEGAAEHAGDGGGGAGVVEAGAPMPNEP